MKILHPSLLTKEKFNDARSKNHYWGKRWPFYEKTISNVNELSFTNSLELGSGELQVVEGSDTMDLPDEYYKCGIAKGLTFEHDAKITPWPITDKAYDLFISLQVWEHLGGKQKEAFQEVARVSKMAYFSFPYLWTRRGTGMHKLVNFAKILDWSYPFEPVYMKVYSNGRKEFRQAHCLWIFDNLAAYSPS